MPSSSFYTPPMDLLVQFHQDCLARFFVSNGVPGVSTAESFQYFIPQFMSATTYFRFRGILDQEDQCVLLLQSLRPNVMQEVLDAFKRHVDHSETDSLIIQMLKACQFVFYATKRIYPSQAHRLPSPPLSEASPSVSSHSPSFGMPTGSPCVVPDPSPLENTEKFSENFHPMVSRLGTRIQDTIPLVDDISHDPRAPPPFQAFPDDPCRLHNPHLSCFGHTFVKTCPIASGLETGTQDIAPIVPNASNSPGVAPFLEALPDDPFSCQNTPTSCFEDFSLQEDLDAPGLETGILGVLPIVSNPPDSPYTSPLLQAFPNDPFSCQNSPLHCGEDISMLADLNVLGLETTLGH
ncbi:hypothetical protein BDZ94DRAFT_1327364 [Collybia nuda]|uniref:Uncharacterized protein n=1 Tax=Collybia nuda TaxID=64659 RepID=A0A9P6CB92_9AGAR|nr:hypothetical protein BDZ94DRAFT_1327364 [Collybia nuda]